MRCSKRATAAKPEKSGRRDFQVDKKGMKKVKYRPQPKILLDCLAGVAELADALRSGRSEITLVWVQIPPSAHGPLNIEGIIFKCGMVYAA